MPTFCTLGDFTFFNFEVPNTLPFGGAQALSIKKMVGGERVIDAMGRDDRAITWSGRFRGSTGVFRARFLDSMRVSGKSYRLIWSQFNYLVVISEFLPNFDRPQEIPYTITCEVVQDLNRPFTLQLPVAYNDAIQNAINEALDLAAIVGDPSVSASLALLGTTINGIASISNATSSVLATITGPLNSAIETVGNAISRISTSTFG